MANICHVHNYGQDYSHESCGLSFGCREVGCITVTSTSPGYYNQAGGYTYEPEDAENVETEEVGTTEQLELLGKIQRHEVSFEEAMQICKDLNIPVSDQDGCHYCGWNW